MRRIGPVAQERTAGAVGDLDHMVRREGRAEEIAEATAEAEPRCTQPAGESPARVIAGEPGSGPAPEAERPTGEAWCRKPDVAVLRGWGTYFRTGNAAQKFLNLDEYVVERLRRFMVRRKGRQLRPGDAHQWQRPWLEEQGLTRLRGTVKYPKPCTLNDNITGKPYAGNPHVRFERRRVETGRA